MNRSIRSVALIALCGVIGSLTPRAQAADPSDVISQVQPRVVKLFGAGGIRNLNSYGTGFLISPKGHILTVWSHLLDADVVHVVLSDGRRFVAKVVGGEPNLDMAVVKIDEMELHGDELPFFDLKAAATAGPGTRILALSNIFKVAAGDEPVSVIHGVISAKTNLSARRGRFEVPYHGPVYLLDAITNNPGSAGGVLVTTDGRLLGMLGRELKNTDTQTWLNYVMPISELKQSAEGVLAGKARPPKKTEDLPPEGIYVPLDFGIVLVPDVVARTPAYVDSVIPNSPAAKAGLKPDDLIVLVNGELAQSIRVLQKELDKVRTQDDLKLVIRRKDALINVEWRVEPI